MGAFLLSPLFQLVFLLLISISHGQVPDDVVTLTATSSVTVTGPCPTGTQGPINTVFSNDTSPFIAGSPIVQSSPPQNVLHPSVCPGMDLQDHSNFLPQQKLTLYYAQPPQNATSNGVQSAFVDMSFIYPTITLEHCGFVIDVFCSATTLTITLGDNTALDMTQQWPSGDFVLTGAGYEGCGSNGVTSVESRFWVLVSSFTVDQGSSQIMCDMDYYLLEEVITDFDISFGDQNITTTTAVGNLFTAVYPVTSTVGSSVTTVLVTSVLTTTPATGPTTLATQTRSSSSTSASSAPSSIPSSSISSISEQADFDVDLDNALGYLNSTAPDFYTLILPGVDTSDLTGLTRRDLLIRRGLFSKLVSKVVSVVKSIPVPPVVAKVVQAATTVVAKAVTAVASVIPLVTITPIDETFPISLSAANFGIASEDTYFGSGTPIYVDGDLSVYCVDCGFTGSMTVVGQLSASITSGITKAVLTVTGPLQFGFNVALIASYAYSKTFEKELGSVPLTPFTIPDIVSIGPELTFGVGLDIDFQANGGLLAGVTVNWDDVDVVVDLINYSGSSESGLLPNSVTKTLLLQGEVTVTGEAYATFGLDFGIDVLDGKFEIDGGFEDKPGLGLDLTITDSLSLKRDVKDTALEARDCQGVDISLTFMNELSADITAGPFSTEIGINTATVPITEYCYSFAQPTSTTSTSASVTIASTSYPVYATITDSGAPTTITNWASTTLTKNLTDVVTSVSTDDIITTTTSFIPTTYTSTKNITVSTSYPYTVITTIISDITTTQTQWSSSVYTTVSGKLESTILTSVTPKFTAPSSSATPLPSNNMDQCPSETGTIFTDSNGDSYELYCAFRLFLDGPNVVLTTTENIQTCAEQCSIQAASLPYTDPNRCMSVVFDTTRPASEGLVNCYGLNAISYNNTLSGTQYDSAVLQTPAACLPGYQAVANSGFDLAAGEYGATPDWTFDEYSSVGDVGFSVSPPNILTWDAAQWTSESFFASQNVTLCPGSSYSFDMYYYVQGIGGTCQIEASLDGTVFATSADLAYDWSGPRTFDLFSGSVVAAAKTQTFMIKPSCPAGTYFNLFF